MLTTYNAECVYKPVSNEIFEAEKLRKFLLISYPDDKCMHITHKSGYYYIVGRKLIGVGTFSKVFKAIDYTNLNNINVDYRKAVKILKKQKKEFTEKIALQEIQALMKINHPNIVKLDAVAESNSKIYLILEYIKGIDLVSLLANHNKLSEDEVIEIISQILFAISYCHSIGIAHRDLKPDNILFDENNKLKILDFGLDSLFGTDAIAHPFCGTPCYAPTELLTEKEYDARAVDIWSIGIITYLLLHGTLPYDGRNMFELNNKIRTGYPHISPHISTSAQNFIKSCLNIKPYERPNAIELLHNPFVKDFCKKLTNNPLYKIFFPDSPKPFALTVKTNTECLIAKASNTSLSLSSLNSTPRGTIPEDIAIPMSLNNNDISNDSLTELRKNTYDDKPKIHKISFQTKRRNSIDYTNISSKSSPNRTRSNSTDITYSDDEAMRFINKLETVIRALGSNVAISTNSGLICLYKDTKYSILLRHVKNSSIYGIQYKFLHGSLLVFNEISKKIDNMIYE